jgi:hypothetical protein
MVREHWGQDLGHLGFLSYILGLRRKWTEQGALLHRITSSCVSNTDVLVPVYYRLLMLLGLTDDVLNLLSLHAHHFSITL